MEEALARGMCEKGGKSASKRCNKLRIKCGSRLETRGSAQRRIKHTYTMYTLLAKPKKNGKKKMDRRGIARAGRNGGRANAPGGSRWRCDASQRDRGGGGAMETGLSI